MNPTLYWMRSQRDRVELYEAYSRRKFSMFEQAANAAGFGFEVATADEFVVEVDEERRSRLLRRGEEVDPRTALFHTKIMTWPAYTPDVWRHLTLFTLLESLGFCTTVPARWSVIGNDKLLTLAALNPEGRAVIPTVRFATRQFGAVGGRIDPAVLSYPAIAKPSDWGGGFGIVRTQSEQELDPVLQLAGAAELTMVVQPLLPGEVVDYRVCCVDGEPVAGMSRTAVAGGVTGNVNQGGNTRRVEPPAELLAPARTVADAVGLPYLCVDFLHDGRTYYLSEIEIDGGLSPAEDFADVTAARFQAYRRHLERHLASAAAGTGAQPGGNPR